jgi:hypothetical protein
VVAILIVSFIVELVISLVLGGLDSEAHTKGVLSSLDLLKLVIT